MNLFTLYCFSVLICIILHAFIGFFIRYTFKKKAMLDIFTKYYASYKKQERGIRYYLKYTVYLIPILNILIVGVELIKYRNVIENIEKDINNFRKESYYENRN